mgnify:CR=1 FL=1
MIQILIVDDEKPICDLIQMSLTRAGYHCTCVYDGLAAADILERNVFDLILLDVMLPNADGFELMEYIRPLGIPVIFLTARDTEDDTVEGLNLGADDYISKPFSLRELLARVKAVLRRTSQDEEAQDEEGVIRFQGLVLDDNRKEVWVDGEHVALTRIEYSLLLMMLENRGKILSRQQLINHVWPHDVIVLDRTVDVNITRLRRKVKAYAEHIVTRQGFGYGFEVKTN